jgi:hypothetical protein
MKTTKFFSVLSLALIFAGINAVYSTNVPTDNPKKLIKPTIRYEVTVHLSSGFNICNYSLYLVQVTDEAGHPVAPAKIFVPGISKYVFNETFSHEGKLRIATLFLPSNVDPIVCPNTLITKPDVKMGPFLPGQTYSFDLYPVVPKGTIKED